MRFHWPAAEGVGRRTSASRPRPYSWLVVSSRPGRQVRRQLLATARRSSAHSSGRRAAASCTLVGSAGTHTVSGQMSEIRGSHGAPGFSSYLSSRGRTGTVFPVARQDLSALVNQRVSHCLGWVVEDTTESCRTCIKKEKHNNNTDTEEPSPTLNIIPEFASHWAVQIWM